MKRKKKPIVYYAVCFMGTPRHWFTPYELPLAKAVLKEIKARSISPLRRYFKLIKFVETP